MNLGREFVSPSLKKQISIISPSLFARINTVCLVFFLFYQIKGFGFLMLNGYRGFTSRSVNKYNTGKEIREFI
jgi:hypothetical protein